MIRSSEDSRIEEKEIGFSAVKLTQSRFRGSNSNVFD